MAYMIKPNAESNWARKVPAAKARRAGADREPTPWNLPLYMMADSDHTEFRRNNDGKAR